MKVLGCSVDWVVTSGTPVCSGSLINIEATDIPGNGMTLEEAHQLRNETLILFAIVFGILAIKKALTSR